jgi:AcrR family transcriptional regulator
MSGPRNASCRGPSAWLVDCAREAFERRGYHGTDLQAVARISGVPAERLSAVFGSKEGMYLAAMYERPPEDRCTRAETLTVGEDVLRRFLESRDLGRNEEVALTLMSAAHTREGAAAAVRLLYEGFLLEPLGDAGPFTDLRPRIAVATTVLLGLTLALDVIRVQPLACADAESLIGWLAPVVDVAVRGEARS